ncbi:hypothetical protein LguiB_020911 [Lonicera macranthoides]
MPGTSTPYTLSYDLLGYGTPLGKKDATTTLFNLSIFLKNKARIVQAGAVKHLVKLIDPAVGMVYKAVAVLLNLVTIPEGRPAIGQEGAIPFLVKEGAIPPLVALSQSGTPSVKEKVQALRSYFRNQRHGNAGKR